MMIEVVNIKKYYRDKNPIMDFFLPDRKPALSKMVKVLDGISFEVDYGESVGIMGASGCGKTTLAKIITRLIQPTSGEVLYRGDDIFRLRPKALRQFRQHVQIIFQDPLASLDPKMLIRDILLEPLIIHKSVARSDWRKRINEMLKKVDLKTEILGKLPGQLAGGERQRVNIARALLVEPKLLICDEPTSSLDMPIQANVLRLLLKLRKEQNLSLLFISHDIELIKIMCTRVIQLPLNPTPNTLI
jgi:ABC-type glutathione transport system ATPase component